MQNIKDYLNEVRGASYDEIKKVPEISNLLKMMMSLIKESFDQFGGVGNYTGRGLSPDETIVDPVKLKRFNNLFGSTMMGADVTSALSPNKLNKLFMNGVIGMVCFKENENKTETKVVIYWKTDPKANVSHFSWTTSGPRATTNLEKSGFFPSAIEDRGAWRLSIKMMQKTYDTIYAVDRSLVDQIANAAEKAGCNRI